METIRSIRRYRIVVWMSILLILMGYSGTSTGEIISADRRINWTPGVPGGIPNRAIIGVNVKNSPYNAVGDGVADDTAAFKTAISACPVGQVLYIPAGKYLITGPLTINKGIVLRGDGPTKTKIILDSARLTTQANGWINVIGANHGSYIAINSGYGKNSNTITLSDASSIGVGDYILINQKNDSTITAVSEVGTGGSCTWCGVYGDSGTRSLGQILKVVGKSGNQLNLSPSIYWDYVASAIPMVMRVPMVENVGFEDMFITQTGENLKSFIYMQQAANCWVKNIETYYADARSIWILYGFRNEVRDSYFHHANNYGSDHGYGVELCNLTSDTLVENNIFAHLHYAVDIVGGPTGNVIAYNYFIYPEYYDGQRIPADMGSHGSHPTYNLFEGNYGHKIAFDYYWGTASHFTVFRNKFDGYPDPTGTKYIYDLRPVIVDAYNRYMSFVGNILGSPVATPTRYETESLTASCYVGVVDIYKIGYEGGSGDCAAAGNDSLAKGTMLRHGNYDYYNKSVIWNATIADHTIPNSLYLTSKPAFFGDLPWPSIGPDRSPMVGSIPAMARYTIITGAGGGGTSPSTIPALQPDPPRIFGIH